MLAADLSCVLLAARCSLLATLWLRGAQRQRFQEQAQAAAAGDEEAQV